MRSRRRLKAGLLLRASAHHQRVLSTIFKIIKGPNVLGSKAALHRILIQFILLLLSQILIA